MAVLLFIAAAAGMYFALTLYIDHESEKSYEGLMTAVRKNENQVKELKELLDSNISTVANANLRVQSAEDKVAEFRDELDIFRDQTADTREKQIKLQDALSRRRASLKTPDTINVNLITTSEAKRKPAVRGH